MMKNMIAALLCILLSATMCSCEADDSSFAADTTTTTAATESLPESVSETVTTTTTARTAAETESGSELSLAQTEAATETVTERITESITESLTESATESVTQTKPAAAATSVTTTSATAAKKPTQTTTTTVTTTTAQKTEPPKLEFSEGTYKGSFGKYIDAMGADVRYDVTVKLNAGSYDYTVEITLSGGMDHHATENCTGTYTVNGTSLTFTGQLRYGTVKKDGISLTGQLSSFASEDETLTVRK